MDRSRSINALFYFVVYLLSVSLLFETCDSATHQCMSLGQSIKDGDTLLSPNQEFALGFFSTTPNSIKRYVGIWYNKVPSDNIVWVANRERPVDDLPGVFTVRSDGNLALLDGKDTVIWETAITNLGSPTNYSAFLMDSGNLVLRPGNSTHSGERLWQSFDHPTDTFLPGMKIGMDPKTNQNQELVSWINEEDPSLGIYTLRVNLQLPNELCINKSSILYWRSGSWNGHRFEELPEISCNPNFNFSVTGDGRQFLFNYYSLPNNYARIVVKPRGHFLGQFWSDNTSYWITMSSRPKDPCDIYSLCGVYGVCNPSTYPFCSCPEKFKPVFIQKWNNGEWSEGCQRDVNLICGSSDDFIHLKNIKLFDTQSLSEAKSAMACRAECLSNCRCTTYAFSDFSNNGSFKCLIFVEDLRDLKESSDGDQGHVLYVRISSSEHIENQQKTRSSNAKRIMTITIILAILILALGAFICLWKRLNMKTVLTLGMKKLEPIPLMCSSTSTSSAKDLPIEHECKSNKEEGLEIPFIGLEVIEEATYNFSDANKLGQGGFGAVYKGILPGGLLVAVKRLSSNSGQGLQEFRNEVMLIAKLQHRNLVRLMGYCFDKDEQILIYEYMPNKSLDYFIFDETCCKLLNWSERFNIILGITRGLLYLHQDSRLRVIHRDLKASNILLDEAMNPKISDFGLARIFCGNQIEANTKRIVGTYGYMSPEYALDGFFSDKSDVYSFGILLLEIISGKKNAGIFHEDSEGLLEYASINMEKSFVFVKHIFSMTNYVCMEF